MEIQTENNFKTNHCTSIRLDDPTLMTIEQNEGRGHANKLHGFEWLSLLA